MWLTEEHHKSEFCLSGYQEPLIHYNGRGGVCVYVKHGINFVPVQPPRAMQESCWFYIKTEQNVPRLYGCVYRSPNSSDQNNEDLLENINWGRQNYREIVLIGDYNLPSISWQTHETSSRYGQKFLDCINDNYLEQHIEEFTRFREGQTPSILDLVISSDPGIVSSIELQDPFGKSDHLSIHLELQNSAVPCETTQYKYIYSKMDKTNFCTKLNQYDWEIIFHEKEINEAYGVFIDVVKTAIQQYVPLKRIKPASRAPWSTREVGRAAKRKRKMWDKYRRSRSAADYNAYKQPLKHFSDVKDNAIYRYENNIIANKNTNCKRYYNYVSRKNKYKNSQISLRINESIETDEKKCATKFNEYFASVFTKGPSNIPQFNPNPNISSMPEINIDMNKVEKKIKELNTHKSSGPDSIPATVLKNCLDCFAPILTIIFRKSYHIGEVPEEMKKATIVPIKKSGDNTDACNYRPISLTPIIAKMFESIVNDNLSSHIHENNILSSVQHGFTKGHSTNTNLIQFWDHISKLADEKTPISIIYTDLRKAFDSVPHDLLIYKLSKYGIIGKNLKWLESFLNNRQQEVKVGNQYSSQALIESGVPQGGVLSGQLFILYINDLPECLKFLRASLYADDAKLYAPDLDKATRNLIQDDLNSVTKWCSDWRLQLNPQKCFLIHYRPQKWHTEYPKFYIGETELFRKQSASDLGVIVSDDLKFHQQVSHACKSATMQINIIRRSFMSRNPEFLTNMYKMYVRPKLEYCGQAWNPVYAGDIDMMEKVQNRFTRLLRHGPVMSPHERNMQLNITDHRTRRLRGDLIYYYKMIQNDDMFQLSDDARTRGNRRKLRIPLASNNIRKHSFGARHISIWNSLPENIVTANSLNVFKSRLDLYLQNNILS